MLLQIFIILAVTFSILYAIIWAALLVMFRIEQTKSKTRFMDAITSGSYDTIPKPDVAYDRTILEISWKVGEAKQCVYVDKNGKLLSPIKWNDDRRTVGTMYISKTLRRDIEPKTAEIATMFKLQHGTPEQSLHRSACWRTTVPF